jgi:hypothetical protein
MYKDVYKICLHHVVVCNTTLKYIFISFIGEGGLGGGRVVHDCIIFVFTQMSKQPNSWCFSGDRNCLNRSF